MKYKYRIEFDDGDVLEQDLEEEALFDTEEEAHEAGLESLGYYWAGVEVINYSDPDESPFSEEDEHKSGDIIVIAVDE